MGAAEADPSRSNEGENMKAHALIFIGIALVGAGCASLDRMKATHDAVHAGLINGLNESNQFSAIVWSWPSKPWGPYAKLDGLYATITNGPYCGHHAVFFLGKSYKTKEWEVFSTLVWDEGKWKPLPVTLPDSNATQ